MSLATKAERAIEATRRLVSASTEVALHANNIALFSQVATNKVMTTTSDGAGSAASSITAATGRIPTLASQAERTIAANPSGVALDLNFVWEPVACFGCNSKTHKWKEGGNFTCPHHNNQDVQAMAKTSLVALRALRINRKNDTGVSHH